MLREISSARQNNRKLKRWFTDANMDLYIWFKDKMPICFQLRYKKLEQEHTISWHINAGYSLNLVKSKNLFSKYRATMLPAPEAADSFDRLDMARTFLQASEQIETSIADFIFARLLEYPGEYGVQRDRALA